MKQYKYKMIKRDKSMNEKELRETKSLLAKLMATENIRVEHKNIPTAGFDLKNRILYLPMFKYMSGDIYDLLVSHEVSHALHTPEEGWHESTSAKGKGYKSFLNVVEDARIEKKIKRRFPGCRSAMTRGYNALLDEDFFGIKGRDLNKLGLIDRINLYTKGGVGLGIEFTEEEKDFVKRVENTETWKDVVEVADDLFAYAKDNESETDFSDHSFGESFEEMSEEEFDFDPSMDESSEMGESEESENSKSSSTDGSGDETSEEEDSNATGDSDSEDSGEESMFKDNPFDKSGDESEENDSSNNMTTEDSDNNEDESKDESKGTDGSGEEGGTSGSFSPSEFDGNEDYDPISETDTAWREKEAELTDTKTNSEYIYTKLPKVLLDKVVIDYKRVHSEITEYYVDRTSNPDAWAGTKDYIEYGTKKFSEFRKDNNKVVSYLAKEFEMKKAADQHKRAMTAKTGMLDMTKIHSVSFSENIFSKITVLPDGKNHGLVMFIDWSGSMSDNMKGTIEQLMNLVMFCKKVQIPFEVYAFSDSYYRKEKNIDGFEPLTERWVVPEAGDLGMNESLKLLNLMSSRMSAREYMEGCRNMILLMHSFSSYRYYNRNDEGYVPTPIGYSLGGTPLNEAIVVAHTLVPEFAKSNNVQMVNAVFLTDGASNNMHSIYKENCEETVHPNNHSNDHKLIMVNSKNRKQYDLERGRNTTATLLTSLRESLEINVVGFYLLSGGRRIKAYTLSDFFKYNEMQDKILELRKNKFIVSKMRGYSEEYIIKGGADLEVKTDSFLDRVDTGAKKGELLRAFKKDRKGKLQNRVMLSRFVDLIAA